MSFYWQPVQPEFFQGSCQWTEAASTGPCPPHSLKMPDKNRPCCTLEALPWNLSTTELYTKYKAWKSKQTPTAFIIWFLESIPSPCKFPAIDLLLETVKLWYPRDVFATWLVSNWNWAYVIPLDDIEDLWACLRLPIIPLQMDRWCLFPTKQQIVPGTSLQLDFPHRSFWCFSTAKHNPPSIKLFDFFSAQMKSPPPSPNTKPIDGALHEKAEEKTDR